MPKIGDIGLIAEIKLASPTEGILGKKTDVLKRVIEYKNAGADAISVITEQKKFKGHPDLVTMIKKAVNLPVLQKDFVTDENQIEESQKLGADALLLIAKLVSKDKLKKFVSLCMQKNIKPVVEIFNSGDLKKALASGTKIIAVNARNLDNFKINVDRACKLLKKIPDKYIKLGFSGVHSRKEVEKYKKAGAKAVLVGTVLMKSKDIKMKILELKNPVLVKICGIRTLKAAKAAISAGADFIGFNFVPSSPRYIDPLKALKIIDKIQGQVKIAGVFLDKVTNTLKLDFVQLHNKNCIVNTQTLEKYDLLDREKQGTGKMVNIKQAAYFAQKSNIFFAGGLTPENVAQVVKRVRPFCVDVASGIETNGKQDLKKIKLFIKNAKGVTI